MLNNAQSVISAVSGKQVRPDVVDGLKSASEKTGVSFEFLVAQATRESGLNPSAKASTTSARGLFQFTSQTWLEVFKANGAKYGQGDLAKKIPLAQSTISQHLNILKSAGLISGETNGQSTCYCVEHGEVEKMKAIIGGL